MKYTVDDLIKLYGDTVITPKSLTTTKAIKNKDRVINKLKIMFEHVEVTGRGCNILFELDKPRSFYCIDKRHENISGLQSLLLDNAINILRIEDVRNSKLTPKQWLEKFGIELPYINIHRLGLDIRHLMSYNYDDYMTNWFPDLVNYKTPNINKIICDKLVLAEINDILNRWYSGQFKALKSKLEMYGIIFQKQVLCIKNGAVVPLSSEIVDELKSIEKNSLNKKIFRRSAEYKEYLRNKGISRVYTVYKCNVEKDIRQIPTKSSKEIKSRIKKEELLSMQEVFIRKEIGKYNGLFGDNTYIPYEYKLDRLLRIDDRVLLEYMDKERFGRTIISKLKKDYDVYTKINNDPVIYKLKYSRLLYKSFAKIIEISMDTTLSNDVYDKAVSAWESEYKKDLQNNSYSNIKLKDILD